MTLPLTHPPLFNPSTTEEPPNRRRVDVLTMRVFICFEGSCEPFDVPPDQTVGAMKQMAKDNFLVQLSDDKQVQQYLELSYGGAALQDSWALCDVGITSGSAIRCLIKSERRPVMHVFNAVTGETLPITGSEALLHMSVAGLKTVVSMQSCLPVSTFRLSTPAGVQLYDCNQLQDYAIELGTTLRLDTWDGWVEFLQGCLLGHRMTVQSHLSEKKPVMRFQLQVALCIAASLGHLDLAAWLLKRGMHAEEPVGVHPFRQWCNQTAHRDTRKCPIHIAAESSQLLILKLFITKNLLTLSCRDPGGRDPLKVAIQCGHRDCVRYLANKLCSLVSLPNMSLPMRLYLQIKHWVRLGQKRAISNQCQHTSTALKARVGDTLLVDGFNHQNMSSKSRKALIKPSRGIKAKALQPLPPISNLLSASHLTSKRALPQIPSLQSVNPKQKKQNQDVKSGQLDKINIEDRSLCRGKFILPRYSRESIPRPVLVGASPKSSHILTESLESFSHHCADTPRENAIYCLTIASTFTEKPWLKQLSIARTLIRKRVHTLAECPS
ncbi:LOW QUALITY PROTEIN: protein ANKUB1-like [Micropterus salmoides]|uniref:LOW QUALITY PROTEIN: protein ANKUB1-like n=2 Tax=Micropterus salmoides TaxID=27706 RepID=UPI0018ED425B|nr:LOW QUALITY PROTEIN: protein ANKUB1-like [Micropterus salmoides]